jgi:hypothetical protein
VSASEARNNHLPGPRSTVFLKLWRLALSWLLDKSILFEAFLFALSLHVLLLPVIWVIGWALPWPKSPTVTTIIEYDLRNWPEVAKPKKIFDIREPARNE